MAAHTQQAGNDEPTKQELKQELNELDAPTEGSKAELAERLNKVHVPDTYVVQFKPDGSFERVQS